MDDFTLILVPLALAFILIAVVDYRKAFLIVLVVGPLVTTQRLREGTLASPMQVILPPVAVGFALAVATRRQNFADLDQKLIALLLAYLGVAVASGFGVVSLWHFQSGISNLVNMLAVVIVCSAFLQSERSLRNALVASMISGAIAGIMGLDQYIRFGGGYLQRATGPFWNPNYLGAHLATSCLASMGIFALPGASDSRRMRRVSAVCFVFSLLGLIATFSGGAYWGFVAGSVVMAFYLAPWVRRHIGRIAMGLIVVVAAVCVVNILVSGALFEKQSAKLRDDYLEGSLEMASRTLQYKAALNMLLSKPLLGVGMNNYSSTLAYYIPWSYLDNDERLVLATGRLFYTTHNDFLAVMAETGTLGTLVFLAMHIAGLKRAILTLREVKEIEERKQFRVLGVTALAMYSSVVVYSLSHNYKGLFMYWVPLVMLWVLPRLSGFTAMQHASPVASGSESRSYDLAHASSHARMNKPVSERHTAR